MNTNKLEEIVDSYYNGQKKQMVAQIKAYGIKAFMIDFYTHEHFLDADNIYAEIVYTFFLLKD